MSDPVQDLLTWRDKLLRFSEDYDSMPGTIILNTDVWDRAINIGKSASKSWMGYHANVYYQDYKPPPPGAHFNIEYGLSPAFSGGPNRNWIEQSSDEVWSLVMGIQGEDALKNCEERATEGLELLKSAKADVSSILTIYLSDHDDSFVRRIADEVEQIKVLDAVEIANDRSPKRQVITNDLKAAQQGSWAPPHVRAEARITAVHQPVAHCRELAKQLDKLAAHLSRASKRGTRDARIGTNIFIGHGRSSVWRDLKDFVKDRLRLPYDEFNRVPVAGITNIARLSEMLDSAACAFVIMTAEDELADGKTQARMNVIHEVGLFQGRLGFTKAIVLLEEGCEEFSNIQGLGQIRFPKGNINAKFEEIRLVLEREGVLETPFTGTPI